MQYWSRAILALFVVVLSSDSAQAARLLKFFIVVDGKVAFTGHYEDGGRADRARVWSYLRHVTFQRTADAPPIAAEESMRPRLRGAILLKAEHADRVIAEVRLTDLLLLRDDSQSVDWKVAPEEVERTAGLAGIGVLPEDELSAGSSKLWVILAVLVAVVAGAAYVLLGRDAKPTVPATPIDGA